MNRDKLVERFEKETGLKFTPEYVVYNEYANWLEQNVVKLFAIFDVSGSLPLTDKDSKDCNLYEHKLKQ